MWRDLRGVYSLSMSVAVTVTATGNQAEYRLCVYCTTVFLQRISLSISTENLFFLNPSINQMVHLWKSESSSSSSSTEKKKKYPIAAESYQLYEEVGQGASASVYRALCIPFNEIVAIKILDFEHGDPNNITHEAITMTLVDHPNVLKSQCSFACGQTIWVVMQYMDGGSCHHILKAAFPEGFQEAVIATVLREALRGLDYLHQSGHIHRDIKAGNILVDSHAGIKLGDFGVSACLFDSPDRLHTRNTFVGTPCWMAPEVMAQSDYDFKADMWSFGITALELAHGHAPFSKYPPHKVLLMTLQNAPPGLDYERDKKFSKSFRQMIAMCLVKDPSKRPSAQKLLKHSFFKHAKSSELIVPSLLEGLPTLGERLEALKMKEADLLAQKKISDGKKEEMSQSEYQRGISSWNFNVDDLKAEASLIHDVAEIIPENDQEDTSISLFVTDTEKTPSQCQPSTTSHYLTNNNGNSDKGAVLPVRCLTIEHFNNRQRYDAPIMIGCHEEMNLQAEAADPTNLPVENGGDFDRKTDKHVFQLRGRFTVTSEDFDMDKAHPSPSLH